MQSKVNLFGHPLHAILVDFPIVLYPALVGLDLLWRLYGNEAFWVVGFWLAAAGAVSALAAIVTGTVDLAFIPDASRAHKTALWHFLLGCAILALYGGSVVVRLPLNSVSTASLSATAGVALDVVGLLFVVVQGYLGGELVGRHHIGVRSMDEGADPVVLSRH